VLIADVWWSTESVGSVAMFGGTDDRPRRRLLADQEFVELGECSVGGALSLSLSLSLLFLICYVPYICPIFLGEQLVTIVGVLALCLLVAHVLDKYKWKYLPASVAWMLIGFCLGICFLLLEDTEQSTTKGNLVFSPNLFFYALLPPIILEAGYTMKRRRFFKNMSAIMTFAVFGTLLSTFFVGIGLFELNQAGLLNLENFSIIDALLYGTVISAVDPVATLAILGREDLHVDKALYAIVFGEAVLNDAVCIGLFDTLTKFLSDEEGTSGPTYGDGITAFGWFALNAMASCVLGVVFGLALSFLMKNTNIYRNPTAEFLLVLLCAYGCYLVAEIVDISGVISIFFCGIVLAHYNWYNLSKESRFATLHGFEGLAMAAEVFVFVNIGTTCALGLDRQFSWNLDLVLYIVPLIIAARGLQVFILANLLNCSRRKKITWRMQLLMWYSGLRGAVCFALAKNIPGENTDVLVSTTLSVVAFTTIIGGGFTESVVTGLKLKQLPVGGGAGGEMGGGSTRSSRAPSVASLVQHDVDSIYSTRGDVRSHEDDDFDAEEDNAHEAVVDDIYHMDNNGKSPATQLMRREKVGLCVCVCVYACVSLMYACSFIPHSPPLLFSRITRTRTRDSATLTRGT
jgi:sodium/hydrogen exchanger 8